MRAYTLAVMLILGVTAASARAELIIDLSKGAKEAVLSPFDHDSIPLRKGLEMTLLRSEQTRATRAVSDAGPPTRTS